MNKKAIVLFFENKFSGYAKHTPTILGLDVATKFNCNIDEFFSNETASYLKKLDKGIFECKLGFASGVITDGKVIKDSIADYNIYIVEFSVEPGVKVFRHDGNYTIFESITNNCLPEIQEIMNELSNSKTSQKISKLKNLILELIQKYNTLLTMVTEENFKNLPAGFITADLWDFMREHEKEFLAIGNVEIRNIPFSAYTTYTVPRKIRELIIGILNSYSINGERSYISCSKNENNAIIRIANFVETDKISVNPTEFMTHDIKSMLDFQFLASNANAILHRNIYEKDFKEYLLVFSAENFELIKEL